MTNKRIDKLKQNSRKNRCQRTRGANVKLTLKHSVKLPDPIAYSDSITVYSYHLASPSYANINEEVRPRNLQPRNEELT